MKNHMEPINELTIIGFLSIFIALGVSLIVVSTECKKLEQRIQALEERNK